MKIFLVRHGITKLNKDKIHQVPETSLAEEGIEQANSVSHRLKDLSIDKIYVSPLLRAQQTAKIIAANRTTPLITCKELEEIRRPSVIVGKKHSDPDVLFVKKKIRKNYYDTSWHHSDEENFLDVTTRVVALLSSLKKEYEENKNILLVTHGYIAKMIAGVIMLGDRLEPEDFLQIYHHLELSNAGLSAIEYNPTTGFNVIFWNDTSHL